MQRKKTFVALAAAMLVALTSVVAFASAPRTVVGGPTIVKLKAPAGGDVRWVMPGVRRLDPTIFGTDATPLREELLPLTARTVSSAGVYQTTMPGPFGDKAMPITGSATVKVKDFTSVAGTTTEDEIDATFEFTSPDGKHTYRVVVENALPQLPDHENFGGVGLNVVQHGRTGIGTALMPQVMAFVTFWGAADFYVDGELQEGAPRFVHFMLTERTRNPEGDYSLAFDDQVDHDSMHAHLILPPVVVTSGGPQPSSVPTGFILPNGKTQPFLHIMFEDMKVKKVSGR